MENYSESTKDLARTLIDFLSEDTPTGELPSADGIFVFGHYDTRLAMHAMKLWQMGRAPIIVLSGKGRDKIPRGFSSEAEYYASLLTTNGVPRSALLLEKESTNTLENVLLGVNAMHATGFYCHSLILCAMPYLLRRSRATFRKHFPDIQVCSSAFTMPLVEYLTTDRLQRIVGEFDRMREYAEKRDIANVLMPAKVNQALQNLKRLLEN